MDNKTRVLDYLKTGATLTAFDGFMKLNIVSVRDYVSMIRLHDGIDVKSEWRHNPVTKKRYKAYWLDKSQVMV